MRRRYLAIVLLPVLIFLGLLLSDLEPDRQVGELAAFWAPSPSKFIELDRMQVHMRDEGPRSDPSPIILLHGTSSSLHAWAPWVIALKNKHRVITLDLPGFGLTGPHPQADYRIETYARFVLRLLDTLKIERCILGGHGMGGEVAWTAATLDRYRIEQLILLAPKGYSAGRNALPMGWAIAKIPALRWLTVRTLPKWIIERGLRKAFYDPNKITPALVNQYFELTLRAGNRLALAQSLSQQRPSEHHSALIKTITQPTQILWGKEDRLMPLEDGQAFQRDILDSELVILPETGNAYQTCVG